MSRRKTSKKYSFDEFKLYYESAERVTDRRLLTNKFNYSVSITLILAIAYIWNWSYTNTDLCYVGYTITLVISVMSFLYCSLWIGQIRDYKLLNNAKFNVLNEMSGRLDFTNSNIISAKPFQKEWDKLRQQNVIQDISSINVITFKSSNMEAYIPKAFRLVFFIVGIISILTILINFELFVAGWIMFTNQGR